MVLSRVQIKDCQEMTETPTVPPVLCFVACFTRISWKRSVRLSWQATLHIAILFIATIHSGSHCVPRVHVALLLRYPRAINERYEIDCAFFTFHDLPMMQEMKRSETDLQVGWRALVAGQSQQGSGDLDHETWTSDHGYDGSVMKLYQGARFAPKGLTHAQSYWVARIC